MADLNFNPQNKPFVMVSIDGGGMRGVIPLRMLVWLEEQLGQPAYEFIDMVSGTSTGAIIAAGLGLRMSAREILDVVYRRNLPAAFGNSRIGFWLRYVWRGLRYAYPMEPFLEILGQYSAGKRVRDLGQNAAGETDLIVLMTTKDLRTGNTYYIVNAGDGAPKFADWPVKGAVAASGAAPLFFPAVMGNLVDGGISIDGNPCLSAAIEAVEYIHIPQEAILHLSLGTGYVPTTQKDGAGSRFWLKNWVEYIILESIDDAALQQATTTRALYEASDFRRYNPTLVPERVRQELGVDFGKINPLSLTLDSRKPEEIALLEAIGLAYAERIDWSQSDVMPWDTPGGQAKPIIEDVVWDDSMYV